MRNIGWEPPTHQSYKVTIHWALYFQRRKSYTFRRENLILSEEKILYFQRRKSYTFRGENLILSEEKILYFQRRKSYTFRGENLILSQEKILYFQRRKSYTFRGENKQKIHPIRNTIGASYQISTNLEKWF